MRKPANQSVAVVIPSRLERSASGAFFIERATGFARAQAMSENLRLKFFVGIDADARIPDELGLQPDVTFVRSEGRSQAAALNAAARAAVDEEQDYIALLEDDDIWEPNFLSWSLAVLSGCDFVSSNQLEIDADEQCIRVNDFPTPSGWIMKAQLWRRVGLFDESLRWHLDNDWLGRLALSGVQRVHLVEATAPVTIQACAQVRPWIANVLTQGGPRSAVRRHLSSRPLVRRTVHQGSGMYRIATDPALAAESQSEYRQIAARYGRIPW